jgi:hypothetical protein
LANEALVSSVKHIMTLSKGGDADGAHAAYAELFSSAEFGTYRPEDQRQALKLLVLTKRTGTQLSSPSAALLDAHRAASGPLEILVAASAEPADLEMLGLCKLLLGDPPAASALFRAGLEKERAANPQSDLCGRLMTRLSAI